MRRIRAAGGERENNARMSVTVRRSSISKNSGAWAVPDRRKTRASGRLRALEHTLGVTLFDCGRRAE